MEDWVELQSQRRPWIRGILFNLLTSRPRQPLSGTPGKPAIVNTLLNDEQSIAVAGFILGLHSAQWLQAGIDIHDHPGILATLYQIGFERSHPHQAPKANRFGRAAAEFAKAQQP